MDLKYISKNDGYIIDRKFAGLDEIEGHHTYTECGRIAISEVLPIENSEMEKSIAEYTFDNMKERVLDIMKKKYFVSDNGIYNFYFEGKIEKDENTKVYAKFQDQEIPVVPTNFNLDFEVEIEVTPRNFLKVKAMEMMGVFTM